MTGEQSPSDSEVTHSAEIDALRAKVEQLKGIKPEVGPFQPEGSGTPRYGIRWNGPGQPLAVPMADGYWTPAHLAEAEIDALKAEIIHANEARDAARDAETDLWAEVERLKADVAEARGEFHLEVSGRDAMREEAASDEREACAKVLQHFFRRAEHPLPVGQSIPTNLQINRVLREAESAIRARGQR